MDGVDVPDAAVHDRVSQCLAQQNDELRRQLDDDHAQYRRKLQSYHDEQLRQAALVQNLQEQVDELYCSLKVET